MADPTATTDHSRAVEDYVKCVYKLTRDGARANTKAIAEQLGVEQGSVSGMMRQLASRGLVEHEPYRGAQLTGEGEQLALHVLRRHRLIELFLVRVLGFAWDEVDADAERLEHAVSDRVIERIDAKLGHPTVDPHGDPIPDATGRIAEPRYTLLVDLPVGGAGRVRRVSDNNPAFLQHLTDHGIELDSELRVTALGPFGSLTVEAGEQTTHLPREAAERIQVTVIA